MCRQFDMFCSSILNHLACDPSQAKEIEWWFDIAKEKEKGHVIDSHLNAWVQTRCGNVSDSSVRNASAVILP